VSRRAAETVLVDQLLDAGLGHDTMLLAICQAFHTDTDTDRLRGVMDDASRPLFGLVEEDLRTQASALADVIDHTLGLCVATDDHHALLLGWALERHRAHPLLLAGFSHELARRAGLRSTVAHTSHEWLTILKSNECFLPISYHYPASRGRASPLRTSCPHELAHAILTTIATTAPEEPATHAQRVLEQINRLINQHSH
jgi:hypothetical protein